jgi:hypothetical protein
VGINLGGKFVMAAANVLNKGMFALITRAERGRLTPRIERSPAVHRS